MKAATIDIDSVDAIQIGDGRFAGCVDGDSHVDCRKVRIIEDDICRSTATNCAVRRSTRALDAMPRLNAVVCTQHIDDNYGFHRIAAR